MSQALDRTAKRILEHLQAHGRASAQDLSDAVGLSTAPCWRRVKAMEADGTIRGYVALVEPRKVGLTACLLVQVSLDRHSENVVNDFERAVRDTPEILECHVTTGDADYLLKIVVADTLAYDAFLHRLMFKLKGVRQMRTSVALRTVKSETRLPLG